MLVLIDNYDSFTYNLYQALYLLAAPIHVFRNDQTTIAALEALQPSHIVISPGPGTPRDAGISKSVIEHFAGRCRILGICLGHQCINEVFGGSTIRGNAPFHGKVSTIGHDGGTLFRGLPAKVTVARYHSLVADPGQLPQPLEVSAWTSDGTIMALRHRQHPVEGLQFHPESFLTPDGAAMLRNYVAA